MKIHKMKLLPQYYDCIKNGTKKIELRLNDDKRRNIKINDQIIFENQNNNKEYLNTKVINIYKYDSFKDLINNFDIKLIASNNITKDQLLNTLNNIYTKEQQDKYGVIAIEIELI